MENQRKSAAGTVFIATSGMNINRASPQDIYATILAEVDALIQSFNIVTCNDEEIRKAREETQKQLYQSRAEIKTSLEQLKTNSEWDIFTIAFYGETNAGKSTLIETLRILLAEPEKVREREKFNRLYKEYEKIQTDVSQAQAYSDQIKEVCDGRIIGDGRSDFTCEAISYSFENDGQKIALLDLPGIEGNEGPVLEAINAAVQKAHAVFYVTGKPVPPQTGDEKNEGTLEKIKKHLGQQAEVFTIFNKRVKNPMALKEPLVDDEEKESLNVLDKTMSVHLGEQYRETLSLSAYPAFLAVANCWQNDFAEKKGKFLDYFKSEDTLLERTHLREFAKWITTGIVSDCKAKIKRANYKKAAGVLDVTVEEIRHSHEQYVELQNKLTGTKSATDKQLDIAVETLKSRFESERSKAVENFKNSLRREIYNDIDTEIDNDKFKRSIENRTKQSKEKLQADLQEKFNAVIAEFKEQISYIVKQYEKAAAELVLVYAGAKNFDTDFNLNIDIKSGIDWVGVISSISSIVVTVILCLDPLDWGMLVLLIVGDIISVGKAIKPGFDNEYRKSQQRKSADENIQKIGDKISTQIKNNLEKAYEPLRKVIEEIKIKNELAKSICQVQEINKIWAKAESRFTEFSGTIKTEGVH